jgi:hypothetical protein
MPYSSDAWLTEAFPPDVAPQAPPSAIIRTPCPFFGLFDAIVALDPSPIQPENTKHCPLRERRQHMPIAADQVVAGHCYRAANQDLRKVLIRQGRRVTYIIRGELAWTVLRTYVDVDDFAADCEAEIDCATLQDLAAVAASA